MRVLIAGCGYVGTELGVRLARAGQEVWGLRRDPESLPAEIRPIAADLLDPGLASMLPPVDRVVFAASANESSPEGYRAVYVRALGNLLEALGAPGRDRPIRVLFVSSTSVYGDSGGRLVSEQTPPDPPGFRGELMLEAESLVLDSPFPAAVLRLGGIYGPGRDRLLRKVLEGTALCPEGPPLWSNRIHRDDAARALGHLLDVANLHEIYLGVDDEPAPLCEIYRELARMLDAPDPRTDPAPTRTRTNKRCTNARLRASGFSFLYPSFREGYARLIEDGALDVETAS